MLWDNLKLNYEEIELAETKIPFDGCLLLMVFLLLNLCIDIWLLG